MPAGKRIIFEPAQTTEIQSAVDLEERKEDTRSKISKIFVLGYLGLILILLITTTFFKLSSDSVKDFLLALSSPLGFVIGYYFKSAQE